MTCGCHPLSRRHFVVLAGGVAAVPLVGCGDGGDGGWPVDLVSEEKLDEMGRASWARITRETGTTDNAAFRGELEAVGTQLLRAAGEDPAAWEMRVFEGDAVNAFALPNEKIGVYEGMMAFAGSRDALATVVGHEIGHVRAEHGQARMNAEVLRSLGVDAAKLFLNAGDVAFAEEIAALLGVGAQVGLTLPYSREHEREADRIGLALMREAGYDPRAAVDLWRRMAERGQGGLNFLSTHPAPADRADRLEELIGDG